MTDSMTDRQRGALIGLAIGDALGAAVEFQSPGTFELVTGYRDGGPHSLDAGQWTDDTSMALALADSIDSVGWDLNDQAMRYLRWSTQGEYSVNGRCFDIGMTVSGALRRFAVSEDARNCASRDENSSGNGSIMRLAPVAIRFADLHLFGQHAELARRAHESSLPTHASEQCLSSCRVMAVMLAGLMHGLPREAVLDPQWEAWNRLRHAAPLHEAVEDILDGSYRRKSPPEIRGSGYVIHSLEASLWAFHSAESFRQAVLNAVNLGDDADTTGAVCGQFAGAYWGESQIDSDLRNGLAQYDVIANAAQRLVSATI